MCTYAKGVPPSLSGAGGSSVKLRWVSIRLKRGTGFYPKGFLTYKMELIMNDEASPYRQKVELLDREIENLKAKRDRIAAKMPQPVQPAEAEHVMQNVKAASDLESSMKILAEVSQKLLASLQRAEDQRTVQLLHEVGLRPK